MSSDRSWMYNRLRDGFLNPDFLVGLNEFVEFTISHPECNDGLNKIRCPCTRKKCQNHAYWEIDIVRLHLMKYGFVAGYHVWTRHGESNFIQTSSNSGREAQEEVHCENTYETMVFNAACPSFVPDETNEPPNPDAQKFYDMLRASNQELWLGCQKHSQLSLVARLLNIKSEHHMSERAFDAVAGLIKEVVPEDNVVTDNFYSTKRLVRGLGLPVQKIHCCYNGCMIFWGEDNDLTACKICGHQRFKRTVDGGGSKRRKTHVPYKTMYYFPLTCRLLRLYASNATANDMRWHAEHTFDEGVMRHPSDSIA